MSQHSLLSFQRHLQAQGKRPGTQERYVSILARLLRWVEVPAEAVTADHAYAFLVERGNEWGLSASWFNVIFHAVVAWLEMRQLPTELRGLRPQRVALQPPRWFTAAETRRLIGAVDQRSFRLFFQVMLSTGMRVSEAMALRVQDLDTERPMISASDQRPATATHGSAAAARLAAAAGRPEMRHVSRLRPPPHPAWLSRSASGS